MELMDLRAAIEPPIAVRAAERATTEDAERLVSLVARMETAALPSEVAQLDIEFHRAVAEATHNPLLVELVEFGSHWTRATREESLQTRERHALSLAGHRQVLRAIEAHDGPAAAAAMAHHVRGVALFIDRGGKRSRHSEARDGLFDGPDLPGRPTQGREVV
jgi:GntR family transcriptional repressor for pyruvate dehydrogenase complex